ncbi:MAG: repressor LexA [Burkholderiaceae bacterium]|nr:repressor LexA [Burkholderiaceae bacterium]
MADAKHLASLRSYYKQAGAFPSMPRLCEVLGLSSTSSVFVLIGRLTKAGYLDRVDGRIVPTRRFFARTLLGSVRAGQPQPADQTEPEVITLDDYLIDEPNRTALHRVRGDSMRDVGILDGDLVAVEHNAPAGPGDIVVAVVDGEITVKTLRRDADGKYFLEAANPAYEPIRPKSSFELLGVVVSVCRRVRR